MEPTGGSNFRHRRFPSSDRFLGFFSPPPPESSSSNGADELNEDDILWTGEFTGAVVKRENRSDSGDRIQQRLGFRHPENFGILAALPEDGRDQSVPVLYRKPKPFASSPASSSSRVIPAIPKPNQWSYERDYSHSMPARKLFNQSAPMNVPLMSKAAARSRKGGSGEVDGGGDAEDDDEMLPPHEMVARGSGWSPRTTFSVLEGAGRTLKGRDLRQVRNAVWRKTGFLD